MAKHGAMKLFAVAILAGTSTAHADKVDIVAMKPGSVTSADGTTTAEQRALLAASLEYQAANAIVIKPRTYANFRPACGNTGGKVDRPDDCTAAEVRASYAYDKEYERLAHLRNAKVSAAYTKLMTATAAALRADPSLKPRLLINGRPACGNTLSKKGPESFCRVARGSLRIAVPGVARHEGGAFVGSGAISR